MKYWGVVNHLIVIRLKAASELRGYSLVLINAIKLKQIVLIILKADDGNNQIEVILPSTILPLHPTPLLLSIPRFQALLIIPLQNPLHNPLNRNLLLLILFLFF
jgi:hypothetical protein